MNILDNQYLYGAVHHDLWALQNYIMAYFIDNYQWETEDFFLIIENPGVVYKTGFTKAEQQITPNLYNNYYYLFKTFNNYIILLDFSIYNYNTIEKIHNLSVDDTKLTANSIQQYCNVNNSTYHEEILQYSFKKSSLDWEYLRKNWDFLHWFTGYWLGEHLIKNNYVEWNYIKSLVMLIEYYPCLYSFFPEKKVLSCNYLHNMVGYCKKY